MPKIKQYVEGFDLEEGMIISGYVLHDINIKHMKKILYREYEYPTVLIWKKTSSINPSDIQVFLKNLRRRLLGKRIIYTQYGNPYECTFGNLKMAQEGDDIIITSRGRCVRVM